MKKTIAVLLSLILLLSLSACSGGTNPAATANIVPETQEELSAEGDSADKYKVTEPIEIEFWNSYAEEEKMAWLYEKIDEFNASQDLITVNIIDVAGGYNAIDEKITAAQAAGKGLPAISLINCPREQTYAANGMLEPLDDYIAATGFEIDDFYDGMIDSMILDADGKIYGIPFGISSSVVYWNMDLLKEAGIESMPTTWDEVRSAAKVIKEKTGKATVCMQSELNYVEVMMRNAGADPLGDGKVADMQNPAILGFLSEYKEMIDAGEAMFFVGTDQSTNIATAFYSGEVACMINTCAIVNQVEDNSEFEIATAFGIKDELDPPISCVAGAAAIIPANNPQEVKNAAFQFLTWLTSKENVYSWSVVGGTYPSRYSVLADETMMSELYDMQPLYEGIYAGLDGIVAKNKTPYQTAAYKVLLDAMSKYFFDGAELNDVWTNAENEINYLLAGN